jgi:putative membrane protein
MTDQAERDAAEPSLATKLAYERTNLAYERTMMAWIRTAMSLISFGFAIYKFFQLEKMEGLLPETRQVIGSRGFAIIMIAIGLFSLAIAAVQHWKHRRCLIRQHIEVPWSLATLTATLISVLGILAMVATIFGM